MIFSGGMPPMSPNCLAPTITALIGAVASAPAKAPRSIRLTANSCGRVSPRAPEVPATPDEQHDEHDDQDQCQHGLYLRSDSNYRII